MAETGQMPIAESGQPQQPSAEDLVDYAQSLAKGMMFAKRVYEQDTLEDLYRFLTNDMRLLIEFDRVFLIVFLTGKTRCVATHGQPLVENKSRLIREVNTLAPCLRSLQTALLLSDKTDFSALIAKGLTEEVKQASKAYMAYSRCPFLLCVPLHHQNRALAIMLSEFFGENVPDRFGLSALGNITPFLAAGLAEKWILDTKPSVARLIDPESQAKSRTRRFLMSYVPIGTLLAIMLTVLLFLVPFPFTIGGEAEIATRDRHFAFCKMQGLVEKVHVVEGAHVERGQLLATLDPKDLDFKIKSAQSEFEILTKEMTLLRASAEEDAAKLAESDLVELKRGIKWKELQYLKSQIDFLTIKAPVPGIVLTRDVESLSGKSFKPGEPFCEIAVPGELCADVYVPEDRIGYVRTRQHVYVYLNTDPSKGHRGTVEEVAPKAEAFPRLGNVCRIRCAFFGDDSSIKVGMKGIGKIHTSEASLWFIIKQRLLTRWNQWMLHFL